MIEAFTEAVRATLQPCTFLLVVPVAAVVVLLGASWRALAAAVAPAVVGGWLVAANWWILDGWWLQASAALVVAACMMVVSSLRLERWAWLREPIAGTAIVSGFTLLATHWWRPCVGAELGSILNSAQGGLIGQLPGMTAYMIGAMLPVVVVVLTIRAIDPPRVELISASAGAILVIVAGALVLGRHDDIVVMLARLSV